jgi:hypothetical protein
MKIARRLADRGLVRHPDIAGLSRRFRGVKAEIGWALVVTGSVLHTASTVIVASKIVLAAAPCRSSGFHVSSNGAKTHSNEHQEEDGSIRDF